METELHSISRFKYHIGVTGTNWCSGTNVSSTLIRKCDNIHSSIGDVALCTSMFARIVSKLTCKYWKDCYSVPKVPLPCLVPNWQARKCFAFKLGRRVGNESRVLTKPTTQCDAHKERKILEVSLNHSVNYTVNPIILCTKVLE